MRAILKRGAISIVLIGLGFAGGTIFGFFNGFSAYRLLDGVPRGALAVRSLEALEKGDAKHVKQLLEIDVDNSLASYSAFKEAPWFPAYQRGWIISNPSEYEEYVRDVATYRKSHPNPIDVELFDKVPKGKEQYIAEYAELARDIRDRNRRIEEMVKKYADARNGPSLKHDVRTSDP